MYITTSGQSSQPISHHDYGTHRTFQRLKRLFLRTLLAVLRTLVSTFSSRVCTSDHEVTKGWWWGRRCVYNTVSVNEDNQKFIFKILIGSREGDSWKSLDTKHLRYCDKRTRSNRIKSSCSCQRRKSRLRLSPYIQRPNTLVGERGLRWIFLYNFLEWDSNRRGTS